MDGSRISNSIVGRILDDQDASNLRNNIWDLEVWLGKVNLLLVEQVLDKMSNIKDLKYACWLRKKSSKVTDA